MEKVLKDRILAIRNKEDADSILNSIICEEDGVKELMQCFFDKDWVLCQKSSWLVSKLSEKQPSALYPYLDRMIASLSNSPHDALIRNTVRAFQFMDIPVAYEGEVFEACFNFVCNLKSPIAVRAFSMTVCYNIGLKYPELLLELKQQLEFCYQEETPAIISRSRQLLKEINKLTI